MKIAICDDDVSVLDDVQKRLQDYALTKAYEFEIFRFQSSVELIDILDSGIRFDLYILDIVMPHITGMMLAKELRRHDEAATLIFLTSSAEYAVDSYEVEAFGYLMKPVDVSKLEKLLTKAMQSLSNQELNSLFIQSGNKLIRLHKREVVSIEVQKDKLRFCTNTREIIETYGTMSEIEIQLQADKQFIKSHRSFLVNMDYIQQIDNKNIYMRENLPCVPVSRSYYTNLKKSYVAYMVTMAAGGNLR